MESTIKLDEVNICCARLNKHIYIVQIGLYVIENFEIDWSF